MSEGLQGKKEQLNKMKRGKGIQHILDEAYKIFGNPMLIHDMEYAFVAAAKAAVNDDPIWNEFMEYGRIGSETIKLCKDESFIDNVANCTKRDGVTYLISDKLKYDRIFGQISNKLHIPVADLVVVACDKPFDDDTPELVKALCDILSKELGKDEYYQDYGRIYLESIVGKLIDGSIEDKGIYAGHVANIDKDLKANIFVAVADITQCDPECTKLVYFRDLFKRTRPAFGYYIYAGYIVILISMDEAALHVKRDISKLYALFERENIYVGISSGFENLFEMRRYYNEAVCALKHGLENDGGRRVWLYGEIPASES